MKKRIYIYIGMFLSLTALFLWNCTDTIGFDFYGDRDAHDDFTIDEAKAFFEKQYSRNMPLSRSIEEKGNKRLTPGDFVPLWDKAVPSAKGRLECYDIPIKNDIHYKAIYSTYENGKARAYSVNVYQKLVVVKNKNNGNMGTYILNLIPDAEYDKKYLKKVGDRFINCADKGGFSGIAFYTMPNLDMILRVNYYKDGVKKRGVFLAGKKEDMEEKMRIAYSIIDGVVVKGKKKVSTRSYGEDDWWDDGWWEDEDWDNWEDGGWESDSGFITIGDSLWYVDEKGNAFIMEDFDGDGILETPVAPGVVITPDEDDNGFPGTGEDPFPPGNEDPDDDGGDNGDGGGSYVSGNGSLTGDNTSTGNNTNGDENDDDQYYIELGNQGINKITTDLKNGNVQIQQVKMSAGEAVLNASGIGLNANGLITSCINFIKDTPPSAIAFGNAISVAGFAIGFSQTWIGYSDGDITTQDKLNLISTALSAAGIVCALIPGGQVASGILGVTSCVIGLVSTLVTSEVQREIHLNFEDGTSFHMYLIS